MRRPEAGAYDPETVNLLREVLDEPWERFSPEQQARPQKSDVALRILRLAMRGERDPVNLRTSAVIEVVKSSTTTVDGLKPGFKKRPPAVPATPGPVITPGRHQRRRQPREQPSPIVRVV
jgi:hypothetical protein